jgi:hypothetical protein
MSIQHGNRGIVKKDLQLYYNREWSKSFKGEATTNLLRRTTTFDAIFWDGYCGPRTTNVTSNTTDVVDPFGKYNAVKVVRNGNNTCDGGGRVAMGLLYAGPTFLIAGQTYTMSFYARSAVAGTLLRGGLNDSHTFGYVTLTTSWVRYSFTFTNISNTSRGFQFISDQATAGETYYIAAPQVEQKSYATLYCDITEDINIRNVTTTNLLTSTYSSLPTNWSVDGSGQGTIGTYSYIENNSAIRIVDVNSNTRFRPTEVYLSGFSGSTTYTFSIKYRKVSGTPTLRFQIPWYNSSNALISFEFPTTSQINIYDIDGWQLAQYTLTSPANAAKVTFWVQDGNDYTTYNHSYDLKEPQIQTGTVPTAWTSNTATANTLMSGGGLLDISGNNYNINLTSSAIAFDSGGYYFNANAQGAITTPVANSILDNLSNNSHTYECWFKLLGTPPGLYGGYFFGRQGFHSGFYHDKGTPNIIYATTWYNDVTASNIGVTLSLNVWYHGVFVTDVENAMRYLYINGVSQSSATLTKQLRQYASTTPYYIGAASTDYASNSIVSSARAYNKALSAAEVLQNFTATRKTYGV